MNEQPSHLVKGLDEYDDRPLGVTTLEVGVCGKRHHLCASTEMAIGTFLLLSAIICPRRGRYQA